MDLQEIWGKAAPAPQDLPDRAALADMLGKESLGLLPTLRRKLRHKMYWGVAVLIASAPVCFLASDHAIVWLSLGLMVFFTLLLMGGVYLHYRRLPVQLDMAQDMLPLLRSYESTVRRALRFEERVGAIFIVPAPGIGALVGASFGGGKSMADLLADTGMLTTLALVTIIFAPLAIYGSIWMNKVAFGKSLAKLRKNIEALEEL